MLFLLLFSLNTKMIVIFKEIKNAREKKCPEDYRKW